VAIFAGLSSRERNELHPLMTSMSAQPGQTIVEQGVLGHEFFIIVDGTATVTRDGVPVAMLGAGDHFGELALFGDQLRTATVTAMTPMRLEVLTYQELMTMLDRVPAIARRLLRRMAQYQAGQSSGSQRPGGSLGAPTSGVGSAIGPRI
jgi:CRP-like cAMP-binding protein